MEFKSNATLNTAANYIKKGYVAPFPLPEGAKSPPAKGFTGNVPLVDGAKIKSAWSGIEKDNNRNIAIRLQTHSKKDFDLISLDVDDYGDKHGDAHLLDLEKQLGSLNRHEIPRSSRRGAKSMSGQYFFKVPKGVKWEGKVCADVEIVQLTHRYAAVYPSVVDGLQYKWYIGEEEIDIPEVDDLPELPQRWATHLRKGSVKTLREKQKDSITGKTLDERYEKAVNWLKENLPAWDGGYEDMSNSLIQASSGEKLMDDLAGNAHDTMVSAMHNIVRLGMEGNSGIEVALQDLKANFIGELATRETNARGRSVSEKEFQSALVGEVESVIQEVEGGVVRISEKISEAVVPSIKEALVSAATANKPATVRWWEYGNNDSEHARMFYDYWGKECLATEDRGGREFALYDRDQGRFVWKRRDELFGALRAAVPNRLYRAADEQQEIADAIAVKAEQGQLSQGEEDEMEEALSIAKNLRARANDLMGTSTQRNVLSQLHSVEQISVREGDFNSKRSFVGIQGGMTLNIDKVAEGDPEEYLRVSKLEDWLTMSTKVTLQEGATHPAWDDFLERVLPDEEIRTFVRKAMGYAFAAGNPEKLAIFLSGESNTGKSTILEACKQALGDYAAPMQTAKIFGRRQEGPTPEIIANIDALMVTMSETGDGDVLSSNAIKQITGNDALQLRGAHKNETINKTPRFVPYTSTNSPPKVTDADKALQGRIMVLPFDHAQKPGVVSHDEDVVNNEEITVAVLAWMFEGYKDFVREGIGRDTWPKEIRDRSKMFTETTNTIVQFISEKLEKVGDNDTFVDGNRLYQMWHVWATNEGLSDQDSKISKTNFFQKIKSNGYPIRINTRINGKTVTILRGYKAA